MIDIVIGFWYCLFCYDVISLMIDSFLLLVYFTHFLLLKRCKNENMKRRVYVDYPVNLE